MTDHVCAWAAASPARCGVELLDRGLEAFEVEEDHRRDLVVGVDFDDAQRSRGELRGPATPTAARARKRRSPRAAMTTNAMY